MDNNVSNNTISSKFWTLQFTKENNFIALKHLLTEQLLISLRLYQQRLNIDLNLEFIAQVLKRKIALFLSTERKLSSKTLEHNYFSKLSVISVGYSCPIALALASDCELSPLVIARSLQDILIVNANHNHSQSNLQFMLEVTKSGWLNFYLSEQAINLWLEQLSTTASLASTTTVANYALAHTPSNLFFVQYAHARCCSLLRLGAKAKLIALVDDNRDCRLAIEQPSTIAWWSTQVNVDHSSAEYSILLELLTVVDADREPNCDWVKLAFGLSQALTEFVADCRFLGAAKRENPQRAIAFLGLIALAQYWLQRILLEKLKIAAPTSL